MRGGMYDEILKKLKTRTPSDIRMKIQAMMNEDLLFLDSDGDMSGKSEDDVYESG